MVRTNYKTRAKSFLTRHPLVTSHQILLLRLPPIRSKILHSSRASPATPEARNNESLSAVHFTAGRDHTLDGRRASRWLGCVPPAARFCASLGGLPDDSDSDVLSRRESTGHGLFGHCAPRASVRADSRLAADDIYKLLWQLAHHAAIQSRPQYRYRRAGSSGLDQLCVQSFAARNSQSTHLQQDQ